MQGNDTANIGQTDACAFEFTLRMETLEYAKQPVDIVHVKPHTIVLDKKDIFTSILPASYLDLGTGTEYRTPAVFILSPTTFRPDINKSRHSPYRYHLVGKGDSVPFPCAEFLDHGH
jgi:hypothetical protein